MAKKQINWKKYNQELVNRGKITFYFPKDLEKNWYGKTTAGKKGLLFDTAIRPSRFYTQSASLIS